MNLNYKDYRNLGICISIICFWTMILFFLVKFVNININEIKYKENKDETQLVMYEDFVRKYNDVASYKKKISVKLDWLEAKIPKNLEQNQFLTQLNEKTQFAKVDLIELIPKEVVNKNNYQQQDFSIIVQGDYFSILDFCQQLNLNNRLVSIQYGKIFIQNQQINAKLTLQIYANN